jgi:hypothetical protein
MRMRYVPVHVIVKFDRYISRIREIVGRVAMGKVLDSLKGISLPPGVESKIRILDGQFEQMETRVKAFDQGRETDSGKGPASNARLDQSDRRKETLRFTPRLTARPDDPTDEESAVLKIMQPPGRQIDANTIAQLMRQSIRTTQTHLNELQRKKCILKSTPNALLGGGPVLSTYALARRGETFLIDLTRAE